MVNALVYESNGPVQALAGDNVLCSWARHLTLTVPLSTQVYKWVTLRWASIPSSGEKKFF